MKTNNLADDEQPEGRDISMECPKCGAPVYMEPIPPDGDSAGGGWLRCSKCDWEEKRYQRE